MPEENPSIIAELLEEQRLLTPAARFAQKHERAQAHLQSRYYRDLIPLERPRPGEQYAFDVDLDKCSGCKACVAACHSLNGLDENESWRETGLLLDESGPGFQQTVTTACHHCVDPACLNGCPVLAYEKDPATGIVHHLDDQCIGCQYCVLKCPYEAPRYSARLGIVRKCDMCAGRLEAGEAPACVQSCPSEAIRIAKIRPEAIRERYMDSEANTFLPASPDPAHTLPTTFYWSSRRLPETLAAADQRHATPAAPHWPLVLMLTLTQASAGLFWCQSWRLLGIHSREGQDHFLLIAASILGFAGLAASVLHLGRPLHAWRAFMGVGRSWLSREIVMFGAFASSVLLLLAIEALPLSFPLTAASEVPWHAASATAALGLFCSVMVYHDTRREFWHWTRTAPQFLGAATLLGAAAALLFVPEQRPLLLAICLAALLKLALLLSLILHIRAAEFTAMKRSAILLTRHLSSITLSRIVLLLLAAIISAGCLLLRDAFVPRSWGVLLFAFIGAGEILERVLFFRAVSQPKMPGGLP